MSKALTNEIVKRVFLNIGVDAVKRIPKQGLWNKEFILKKSISIEYDDGIVKHDVFAGRLMLDKLSIDGVLIDLSTDSDYEFLFVFKMGNFPVHAINILDNGNAFIRVYDEKRKVWKDASIYIQASILAGFERLNSYGVLWNETANDINDIYDLAVNYIQAM